MKRATAKRTAKPGPTSAHRVEAALQLLRANGGRLTTSRRLLLSCLFGSNVHRTAEDLLAEVQALAPDVHMSTIYRNLDELERLGVVVHAHLGHGPATYHLASETHGHLVCESCGTMFEAPEPLFRALAREAHNSYGFTVDPRHFAVLGRCAPCGEAQPSQPGAGASASARQGRPSAVKPGQPGG
jgi:Fur family ferric uptake transcriptional regulator